MTAKISRRLTEPVSHLLVVAVLILASINAVSGAQRCQTRSKGYSVLYGQPPTSKNVRYWDRTASALKARPIKEVSVYYDSKQECIAGVKLTYGAKPGAVSHMMGTERGPGFYEKLLMLEEKEFINRVDIGHNSKCVQYIQWYTSASRTMRAGASSSSTSSKTGVSVPENSSWHLAALRGTVSDGIISQLQTVWGDVVCKAVEVPASRPAPAPASAPAPKTIQPVVKSHRVPAPPAPPVEEEAEDATATDETVESDAAQQPHIISRRSSVKTASRTSSSSSSRTSSGSSSSKSRPRSSSTSKQPASSPAPRKTPVSRKAALDKPAAPAATEEDSSSDGWKTFETAGNEGAGEDAAAAAADSEQQAATEESAAAVDSTATDAAQAQDAEAEGDSEGSSEGWIEEDGAAVDDAAAVDKAATADDSNDGDAAPSGTEAEGLDADATVQEEDTAGTAADDADGNLAAAAASEDEAWVPTAANADGDASNDAAPGATRHQTVATGSSSTSKRHKQQPGATKHAPVATTHGSRQTSAAQKPQAAAVSHKNKLQAGSKARAAAAAAEHKKAHTAQQATVKTAAAAAAGKHVSSVDGGSSNNQLLDATNVEEDATVDAAEVVDVSGDVGTTMQGNDEATDAVTAGAGDSTGDLASSLLDGADLLGSSDLFEAANRHQQEEPGAAEPFQEHQQSLQHSIVSRLVGQQPAVAAAPVAAVPAAAAAAPAAAEEDLVEVKPITASAAGANAGAAAGATAAVPAGNAAAVSGSLKQQRPQQQQGLMLEDGTVLLDSHAPPDQPATASPQFFAPGAETAAAANSPEAQQLLGNSNLPLQQQEQQRKQQLLQQHQQWQQQQLQQMQIQQQQAPPTNLQNPPSGVATAAVIGTASGSTLSQGSAGSRFRAIVPPSVTCNAAPHLCDVHKGPGDPAFCSATAPYVQAECVGGCCMSSGRCSSTIIMAPNLLSPGGSSSGRCASVGLGAEVSSMSCTGLNSGQAPDISDGSLCQNLGCRLAVPGCLTLSGGVGGHCVGKVVALGHLAKCHPEGVKFLGYPCLDATANSSSTLNLLGQETDSGYYVAKRWTACNCNGAAMPPPSTAPVPPTVPAQQYAGGMGSAGGVLPGARKEGADGSNQQGTLSMLQLLSMMAANGNASQQAAAGVAGNQQHSSSNSNSASSANAGVNSQAVSQGQGQAAAAAGLMSVLLGNGSSINGAPNNLGVQGMPVWGLAGSDLNPEGLAAAAQQLQGNQHAQAMIAAAMQQAASSTGAGGSSSQQNTAAAGAAASGAGAGAAGTGLSWADLLKEASAKAAAAAQATEHAAPPNSTAAVLGGWVSALLTAAGAGKAAASAPGSSSSNGVGGGVLGRNAGDAAAGSAAAATPYANGMGADWQGGMASPVPVAGNTQLQLQGQQGQAYSGAIPAAGAAGQAGGPNAGAAFVGLLSKVLSAAQKQGSNKNQPAAGSDFEEEGVEPSAAASEYAGNMDGSGYSSEQPYQGSASLLGTAAAYNAGTDAGVEPSSAAAAAGYDVSTSGNVQDSASFDEMDDEDYVEPDDAASSSSTSSGYVSGGSGAVNAGGGMRGASRRAGRHSRVYTSSQQGNDDSSSLQQQQQGGIAGAGDINTGTGTQVGGVADVSNAGSAPAWGGPVPAAYGQPSSFMGQPVAAGTNPRSEVVSYLDTTSSSSDGENANTAALDSGAAAAVAATNPARLHHISSIGSVSPADVSAAGSASVMPPRPASPHHQQQQQQQPQRIPPQGAASAAAMGGAAADTAAPAGPAAAVGPVAASFVTNRPALYGPPSSGPTPGRTHGHRSHGRRGGGIAPMGMTPSSSSSQGGLDTITTNSNNNHSNSNNSNSNSANAGTTASNSSGTPATSSTAAANATSSPAQQVGNQQQQQQPGVQQQAASQEGPKDATSLQSNSQPVQTHRPRSQRKRLRQQQQQQQQAQAPAAQPQVLAASFSAPFDMRLQAQQQQQPLQQQANQVTQSGVTQPQQPQQQPPHQQLQPQPQPQQQPQQPQQPEAEVQVQVVEGASSSANLQPSQGVLSAAARPGTYRDAADIEETGSSPLKAAAASSASRAVGSPEDAGTTFVMPGGPIMPGSKAGSKRQASPGSASAAAQGHQHQGAGVVIDDEAWRQQTAGSGSSSSSSNTGQRRQVWTPTWRRL